MSRVRSVALVKAAVSRAWRVARGAPKRSAAGVILVSSAGLFAALWYSGRARDAATGESVGSDEAVIPWCAEGLEAVAGGGCYAAPASARPGAPLPLVIYLHGLFEKGPLEDEELDRQRRVARRGTERGFAVLALRGAEGACGATGERAALVCWPSNERTADKAPSFVEGWQPALRTAEERHPFAYEYVLGFSNGGYFAGLVAERALYDANAFVVAHAGPVAPVKALGKKPPVLLMSADEDLSQEEMVRLDDELTRDDWPHAHYVRDGGHALPDSDIDVALTFFERTRTESLPLRPPLSTRIPRARMARRVAEAEDAAGAPSPVASAPVPPTTAEGVPAAAIRGPLETPPDDAPGPE